jgi:hypothetical protein
LLLIFGMLRERMPKLRHPEPMGSRVNSFCRARQAQAVQRDADRAKVPVTGGDMLDLDATPGGWARYMITFAWTGHVARLILCASVTRARRDG